MRIKSAFAAFVAALVVTVPARGQSDTLSLQGRSIISLGWGLTGERSQTQTAAGVIQHTSGQVGALSFVHWIRPTVAVEISTAVLDADQTVSGSHVHDNAILPILFGLS